MTDTPSNPTPNTTPDTKSHPTTREIWMSRLGILGIFGAVGVMALVVFLSDPAGFEVRNPPNDNLVALADALNASFESWVEAEGEIRFTLDTLAEGRTPEDTEVQVRDLADEYGLESLRDLAIVRISGRLKISGTIDRDD